MNLSNSISDNQAVLKVEDVNVFYSSNSPAVAGVNLEIFKNQITAFIGPSGCGKSTILRCFNRLNDLIEGAKVRGKITFNGHNLYDPKIDPVAVRRHIGMVFQRPNPFPKSIYENIAFGPRINGFKGSKTDMDDLVEKSLRSAAIWDEVKDKLKESGLALSGGQQQRLCIARAIAVEPQVILMDEPCSALDPISTLRIEELMQELKQKFTLVIVTHNMQQASRSADMTAFFNTEINEHGKRTGKLVEMDRTSVIFSSPKQVATEEYISGRFG
ncbi:phosphate ABC transporter ATP-binding protein PstB [Pseudanabaena sp. ABRG5-3]|uniref:phosphate ABC transporter ATP-binding protein PstB n=1 Tax=Pseudanabaena sp. ABRG5-3 TaxID=685565 RepID=UPI000DC73B8F|nr:phosphate ABC transporter ATP-binding protein PstB [Pseudanabaena sp. ABRG5-3]BBC23846.1 phosphate import ATP-binding protein [Pseudanabaena sp. ABRG5-3]